MILFGLESHRTGYSLNCINFFISIFFSMSETALMSLSKVRLRNMVEEKVKGADLVEKNY